MKACRRTERSRNTETGAYRAEKTLPPRGFAELPGFECRLHGGIRGKMNILIRTQGTLAIYEQIVDQLKNAIVTGELKAGEALPSIRALAGELEVSVITTKRAYEELEKEKLIRSVPGKGFYVCEYNRDYLKEKLYIGLEQRLAELLADCRKAGMSRKDILDMAEALMESW